MTKTATDLIAEAKAQIPEITVHALRERQARGERFVLLDVRDQPEVNLGKIPGALHISRGTLEGKVEAVIPRDADVVIYCASGNRSALAAVTLRTMGYRTVASLAGGIRDWAYAGGDVD
ncbi:MAG TPA: rhodanese-like domain-containing protein [Gemmatimonadaceae bacterium]